MSFHRPVVIMQMPEQLEARAAETFMQDFEPMLAGERPRFVFDFTGVRRVDRAGAEMILHCLEQAMRREGELKLAALSAEAEVALELMRRPGVLQTFLTCDEAVRSFSSVAVADNTRIGPSGIAQAEILRKAS